MDNEKKDYKKLYKDIVASDWFKRAYFNKSLGECPFDIPELRESEDERIRKALIDGVRQIRCKNGITQEQMIAYLEKQKDIKYSEEQMEDIRQYAYNKGIVDAEEKQKEQKPILQEDFDTAKHEALWGEQKPRKFKLGDKVHWYDDNTNVSTITGFRDDAYLTDSAYGLILYCDEDYWEKVEQQPAEWSEEDEKMLNLTKTQLRILQSHLSHTHSERMSDMEYSSQLLQIEKCVSWLDIRLKSLRPQPHWKPSKEQIDALISKLPIINGTGDKVDSILESLYEDLKKLM